MPSFKNKKIIIAVCGGIAAYKSAELVRLLIKQEAQVQVVLTQAGAEFVSVLTFQALSGRAVCSKLFASDTEDAMEHIELARWADIVIIAPATANSIAKIAHGIADNLLTTLCLASNAPLIIAPAMNHKMWLNSATQANVKLLKNRAGVYLCGPAEGVQACGDNGSGRMVEPLELLDSCAEQLRMTHTHTHTHTHTQNGGLSGRRVLITAGPTLEDIDPVRYLSNRSSGKMGYAIAQAAQQQGADVILISGPVALQAPENITLISVRSAQQMYDAVFETMSEAMSATDIFIATAAVADYRPIKKIAHKIKKSADQLLIELTKNPDILADVAVLPDKPLTIGFAAETNDIKKYALDKLTRKKLDMIVANEVSETKGFEVDHNELHLFWYSMKRQGGLKKQSKKKSKKHKYKKLAYSSKQHLAEQLIHEVTLLMDAYIKNKELDKQ